MRPSKSASAKIFKKGAPGAMVKTLFAKWNVQIIAARGERIMRLAARVSNPGLDNFPSLPLPGRKRNLVLRWRGRRSRPGGRRFGQTALALVAAQR